MNDDRRDHAGEERAEARLRSLVLGDALPAPHGVPGVGPVSRLDDKTRAMITVAAVIASGGGPSSYRRCVDLAFTAGATAEEIVDVLLEVAPTIGLARVGEATVELGTALGYDIDGALEGLDPPCEVRPSE
jgi:4-carboxymuconolactone decarboxylase